MNVRTRGKRRGHCLMLFAGLVLALLLPQTGAAQPVSFVVTSTADSGAGSLRQAILDANAAAGSNNIDFSIPGAGPHSIAPSSPLPTITDPVVIDGLTQAGASCAAWPPTLRIELNGANAGPGAAGLRSVDHSTTIRGLAINRFAAEGIRFEGTFENSPGHRVECNFIGTDIGGTQDRGNAGDGIYSATGTIVRDANTSITRNLISGNDGNGVHSSFIVNTVVQGNNIGTDAGGTRPLGNDGDGVLVFGDGPNNTQIGGTGAGSGNRIAFNVGAGVAVGGAPTEAHSIVGNSIYANTGPGIDLARDGVTVNDAGDLDSGENNLNNYPVLRSVTSSGSTTIEGRLDSTANTTFRLEFFANPSCDPSGFGEGLSLIGSANVSTDAAGNAPFNVALPASAAGRFVTATATDEIGSTSEFSPCAVATPANDSWVTAARLNLVAPNPSDPSVTEAAASQYLFQQGQSAWFKLSVTPRSKLVVTATGLPANYDLTLYKDIAKAYNTLKSPQDLVRLGAEFAPEAFSPEAFSPEAFSPEAFSPEAFSPEAFSPEAFSPDVYAPEAFSPEAFSPEAFSPEAFSPEAFSPEAFSPEAFSPEAFSPEAFSPEAFSPEAFLSSQTRSLIAVSAFPGNAAEGIIANTWDNSGDWYVRVRGSNGAFSLAAPFALSVTQFSGACGSVGPILTDSTITPVAGNYKTIIVTDPARMAGTAADKTGMRTQLNTFAARPEIAGVVVDVGADARIGAANAQADANRDCPASENIVADAIKSLIDGYRQLNASLEYVVLVGNDDAIPFFRYPDQALLAPESNYVPPVGDGTASQASLRLDYVLSQDRYGAAIDVSIKTNSFPIPDLAVGRLVETPNEVSGMLNAYAATTRGVTPITTAPLVTGYDFLDDVARAVRGELEASMGPQTPTTLIADRSLAPTDPAAWRADQLRSALLGKRHDVIFLAGHFSQGGALAADYSTRLSAAEVAASTVNLRNSIVFSAGCHSGYNTLDSDRLANVTEEPDWAQAFARKQATLIAGTGYQYGDTDFIEYGERLYAEFARQLRVGSGPVAVGKALVAAKQDYLANTPSLRGIHEKTVLQAALYGLPMLSIDMPFNRVPDVPEPSLVGPEDLSGYANDPGATLGLQRADVTLSPALTPSTVALKNIDTGASVITTYYAGPDGVAINPAEPVLPLDASNVGVPNTVLRGVGFRGARYTDTAGVRPLTGAPATEMRGVHAAFQSEVWYPIRPWNVNYFDALADATGGATRLMLTPAQYRSATPTSLTGTLRKLNSVDFRLFYSDNIESYDSAAYADNVPALSAAPSITGVDATIDGGGVGFSADVVGNPAAGIQEVWVTYTRCTAAGACDGIWRSLDLAQDGELSTRWQSTLSNVSAPEQLRYMVQAVNGIGLVTLATNLGAYYSPAEASPPGEPSTPAATQLELVAPPASAAYGQPTSFSARLSSNNVPLVGEQLVFSLGAQRRTATTNSQGVATASLTVTQRPGPNELRVSYTQTQDFGPASAASALSIQKQPTALSLTPSRTGSSASLLATLSADGRPLAQKTIFFVGTGQGRTVRRALITDYAGRVSIGPGTLPRGTYSVRGSFGDTVTLDGGQTVSLADDLYGASAATASLTIPPPDTTPPVLRLPAAQTVAATGPSGAVVSFSASATDADPAAPAVLCSPASGSTFAPGTTTVDCSATDAAGNTARGSFPVRVTYRLQGFTQPVDMSPQAPAQIVWNTTTRNKLVPLRFELFAGATELTNTGLVEFSSKTVSCSSGTNDEIEEGATGATGLRYDTGRGQYVYTWRTPNTATCYSVTITAKDGSSASAPFSGGSTLTAYFRLR